MKVRLCTLCFLGFAIGATLTARAQDKAVPQRHDHGIYQTIDRAYRNGEINLDKKILFKFYASSHPEKLPGNFKSREPAILKCGTPAIADYHRNRSKLSRSTVSQIESMMSSATIQSSETYQSPSGNFVLHYETSGSDAVPPGDEDNDGVPDYVEEAAAAADSSYRHEVQRLGYSNPIPSGQTYDIQILNLGTIYGRTFSPGSPSGNTLIQIENDFQGFPPNDDPEGDRIGALKVTIAHELKHAIQYTANQWRGETGDWLEMDATLMEEVVYDNVNDYYNYLRSPDSIFNNPESSFYPGSYYQVTWALYFEQQYGSQFWVNVWQIIQDNPYITMANALDRQLGRQGAGSFNENFVTSQLWHYASGSNSSPNYGFDESANYPTPSVQTENGFYNQNFTIPRSPPVNELPGFAAKYYQIPVPEGIDGEIRLDLSAPTNNQGVGLIAYYNDGRVKSASLESQGSDPSLQMPDLSWENIDRLGLILANSGTGSTNNTDPMIVGVGSSNFNSTLSQNYPNPFNPQTRIRFTLEQAGQVQLKVYNSAGRLVRTLVDGELDAGLHEPVFDGSNLASGVYFYQLITDQQTFVKKMTLVK